MTRRSLAGGLFAATLSPLRASTSLAISTDPRIELVTIVQLLADYQKPPVSVFDSAYKRDVEAHFGRYRTHPAVNLCRERSRGSFGYDAVPAVMLGASALPALAFDRELPRGVERRAGGRRKIEEWLGAMAAFARDTDFAGFAARQQAVYRAVEERTRAQVAHRDLTGEIESYFREKQRSYSIVLALLGHSGGFSPRYPVPGGGFDAAAVIGPGSVRNGLPDFGTERTLEYLVWHEFGHAFVNPAVEANGARFDASSKLYRPIEAAMKRQAYGDWETSVKEHLIRAVTLRLTAIHHGEAAAGQRSENERMAGFSYVDGLAELLRAHETGTAPFRQFVPRIADWLRAQASNSR